MFGFERLINIIFLLYNLQMNKIQSAMTLFVNPCRMQF